MALPDVLLQVTALLAAAVIVGVGARRLGVPLTVVLTGAGFAANAVLEPLAAVSALREQAFHDVVVFVFLPVLVFAAALELSVRSFLRNLVPVLALATVAFAVSAVLVGAVMAMGLGIPTAAALLFGVLISATDPVAVVAVFKELGVPGRLLTLVEGESLLNDGVAIVLFDLLLAAAIGERISLASGALSMVVVFAGGALVGLGTGFLAAMALPWMDRLSAGALTVAVAYGSFVASEHLLGVSGVVATAVAGLVLAGFAPSRASAEVRELWEQLWESVDYMANALLFLLIGLVLQPRVLLDNVAPILLAIVAVLAARPLAVVPVVSVVERVGRIPRVGRRNEAVLVWGGLRGGVALALALALPETLEQRDLFIAMTAGVVLATLMLNATTIGALVRRLGLDRPDRTLLREVDDQVEEMSLGQADLDELRRRDRSGAARLGQRIASALPTPPGEPPEVLSYAEASARQIAAQRTAEALDTFSDLPGISRDAVDQARRTFSRLEDEAIEELDALRGDEGRADLVHHQAQALSRATAREELDSLVGLGLLPRTVADRADDVVEGGLDP